MIVICKGRSFLATAIVPTMNDRFDDSRPFRRTIVPTNIVRRRNDRSSTKRLLVVGTIVVIETIARLFIIRILKPTPPRSNAATTTVPLHKHNRLSPLRCSCRCHRTDRPICLNKNRTDCLTDSCCCCCRDKRLWNGAVVVALLLRGGRGFNMCI